MNELDSLVVGFFLKVALVETVDLSLSAYNNIMKVSIRRRSYEDEEFGEISNKLLYIFVGKSLKFKANIKSFDVTGFGSSELVLVLNKP